MKRVVTIIAAVTAVHFALMYFTTAKTVDHNLSRALTFFGTPPPDTWLTELASHTSAVLRQPLEFLPSIPILPATEPKEVTTTDRVIGWVFYSLNSILWGGMICLAWHRFRRRVQRQLPG